MAKTENIPCQTRPYLTLPPLVTHTPRRYPRPLPELVSVQLRSATINLDVNLGRLIMSSPHPSLTKLIPSAISTGAPSTSSPARSAPLSPHGTSPSVPNIPPRVSTPSSTKHRTVSTSKKLYPEDKGEGPKAKTSNDSLIGRKTSPIPQANTSALTHQLGSPPQNTILKPSRKSSRPSLNGEPGAPLLRGDDASSSSLAEITNAEKAKVLRRHLVSAEERRPSGSTPPSDMPTPSRNVSPLGDHGDSGLQGVPSGVTSLPENDDSQLFPIPFDALGGDVT